MIPEPCPGCGALYGHVATCPHYQPPVTLDEALDHAGDLITAHEDPRMGPDRCGVTTLGGTGLEWVCIKAPHGKVYTRNTPSPGHHRGDPIYSAAGADAHYFVRRYPNSDH